MYIFFAHYEPDNKTVLTARTSTFPSTRYVS